MLTLGDKIIAGSFKAGASWEVGDIGISAFGIDEALNKRRYLNGQVISQAQFVEFTAMLKSRVSVYPNLETSEVNWQAEVTNSKLGQCGKFVIDDDAGTIRLPKVVNINGLQDLTGLGGIKAESLPNITGAINRSSSSNYQMGFEYTTSENPSNFISGAFSGSQFETNKGIADAGSNNYVASKLDFDASLSSSTYQDNAPVQQEAVQYPYFIQVAEGIENSVDVSREIELNNPFSLLDYKYSEYELSNASWLLSNGQYNSGATYPAVYNLLLAIYNGTTTKAGVSVKLSTETYTDTDFVLNTSDTTFRLPIKVLMAGSKRVAGNGMTLGMTDGTTNYGVSTYPNMSLVIDTSAYGTNTGTSTNNALAGQKSLGVTTDETKSGIETSANGLYLYFYVGETIQDANIIAASAALTTISNLTPCHVVIDTYKNGTSWYRIYDDGWCEQGGYVNVRSSAGEYTYSLLKEFKDTDYLIMGQFAAYYGNDFSSDRSLYPYTTSQFKILTRSITGIKESWRACGYLADGEY